MKTLIDGTEVPFETRTRNTNKGYVLLTEKEIKEEDDRTREALKAEKKHNARWDVKREKLFEEKEDAGLIPKTFHDHFDLIYKELNILSMQKDVNLSKKMASVIRHRQSVKSEVPKEDKE